MAIAGTTVFEVRTAGADTNGGGFVPGASGTDWSQQNSAQYALTGLASAGSGNTILYASASADMVGNIAQAISGTNVNTGFFQITAVSVGVSITFSTNAAGQSIASGVAASLVLNIGGALLTINKATNTAAATGNTIWVKSGTYTVTATITLPNSIQLILIGYTTTRGDNGRPTVTSSTNSVALFTVGGAAYQVTNFSLTHTAATRGDGFVAGGAFSTFGPLLLNNVIINGCLNGVNGTATNSNIPDLVTFNCEIKSCIDAGITNGFSDMQITGCFIHNNGTDGVNVNNGRTQSGYVLIENSILYANGGKGLNITAAVAAGARIVLSNSVFHGNTSDGVTYNPGSGSLEMNTVNCIFTSNGGWGVRIQSGSTNLASSFSANNAYFGNTSGAQSGWISGVGDVTLSGIPFTSPSGADFSLNNTSGQGAACRAVGFPGTLAAGGTGFGDIGALQHQDSGGTTVNYLGGSAAGMSSILAM